MNTFVLIQKLRYIAEMSKPLALSKFDSKRMTLYML